MTQPSAKTTSNGQSPTRLLDRDWQLAISMLQSYATAIVSRARRRFPQLHAKISPSDLVQEAALRAAQRDHGTRNDELFSEWLKGILENVLRDQWKHWNQQKRDAKFAIQLESILQEGSRAFHELYDIGCAPDAMAQQREKCHQVQLALAKISPEAQQILTDYYFGGWTVQELADAANCSLGAMKGQLRNARNQLRKLLPDGMLE